MGKVKKDKKISKEEESEIEENEDVSESEEETKKKNSNKKNKDKGKKTSSGNKSKKTSKKDEQLLKKKRKREDKKEKSNEKKVRNFINKDDVKVKKILTVKKIKDILYAEVMYTEKGSKKKEMKGLIQTTQFIDSEPELLLQFYEDNIEFTKNSNESKNDE